MRGSAVFCLAVSFAMFGFGLSLQCYSCPDGDATRCDVKKDCVQGQDTCLKLTSADTTYTDCVSYTDCNFNALATRFVLPEFTFSCCQTKLCNHQEKSLFHQIMKKIIG